MKKIMGVLLGVLVLLSIQPASANICYQETTNVSTACGGLGGGNYACTTKWGMMDPCSNIYDGNWETHGSSMGMGMRSKNNITITYQKPADASNEGFWQIKSCANKANISIPASCWNYDSGSIKFAAKSDSMMDMVEWLCFDGTWVSMRMDDNCTDISEEGIYWSLPGTETTTTTNPTTSSTTTTMCMGEGCQTTTTQPEGTTTTTMCMGMGCGCHGMGCHRTTTTTIPNAPEFGFAGMPLAVLVIAPAFAYLAVRRKD